MYGLKREENIRTGQRFFTWTDFGRDLWRPSNYMKNRMFTCICVFWEMGSWPLSLIRLKRFSDPKKTMNYYFKGPINVGMQNAGGAFSNAFRD